METEVMRTVLITGANVGIGKELARQLALREGIQTIYLGCRNEQKAASAKTDLERSTGKRIFEILIMDVSETQFVRSAIATLPAIDGLVMNAGGMTSPTLDLTRDGVTRVFAQNVLGHVILLEELLRSHRLNHSAVYVSSEAVRGVAFMGAKRPTFSTRTPEDIEKVINGEEPKTKHLNPISTYAEVKLIGSLWIAALARQHPALKFVSVSPGGTMGTNGASDMPAILRYFMKLFMPLAGALGMMHSLEKGAANLVNGLTNVELKSGEFYAAPEGKLIGPLVPQSPGIRELNDQTTLENTLKAIHSFIDRDQPHQQQEERTIHERSGELK